MGIFLAILGAAISYAILYVVIKAAVRDGIIEARNADNAAGNEDRIAQRVCPNCNKEHDCDYPKCPHCKHQYFGEYC